jgi:hypothetical protein
VLFAGYEFENDIYRRRLKLRSVQKRNLCLTDEERQRVTCCPPAAFRVMSPVQGQPEDDNPSSDPVKALDAVVEAGIGIGRADSTYQGLLQVNLRWMLGSFALPDDPGCRRRPTIDCFAYV